MTMARGLLSHHGQPEALDIQKRPPWCRRLLLPLAARSASAGLDIEEETSMLKWALIFLVVALVAAVLGFGGIATGAADIARILFVLFLAVFVVSLVIGLVRRA
jgi:uncharacterized membrane protein YtjA (UPF0391 family)